MSNNNYNEYTDGIITSWSNWSEDELISKIADENNLSREQLVAKVEELKTTRYKGNLTFWKILSIAENMKKSN